MSWNETIYDTEYNKFFKILRTKNKFVGNDVMIKMARGVFVEAEAEENYEKCKAMIDAWNDATELPPIKDIKEDLKSEVSEDDIMETLGESEFVGDNHDVDRLMDSVMDTVDEFLNGQFSIEDTVVYIRDLLEDFNNAQ